jgi:hypothetical protein
MTSQVTIHQKKNNAYGAGSERNSSGLLTSITIGPSILKKRGRLILK